MKFKDLSLGMKLYSFRYGQDDNHDKRIGYDILTVIHLDKDYVSLEYDNGFSFNVNQDVFDIFEEYDKYTEDKKSEITKIILKDSEDIGYTDALYRYEDCNIHFLKGVLKAVKKLIKEKKENV